jgi:hypothetical protein
MVGRKNIGKHGFDSSTFQHAIGKKFRKSFFANTSFNNQFKLNSFSPT